MKTDRGTLFVFSGPSGTGKGTILAGYFDKYKDDKLKYSVSATTRNPRAGEVDGVNYFFKTKDEFQQMIADGEFLEWASFCDNFYGTPLRYINDMLDSGVDIVLEIETVGAMKVRERCPDAVMIFVLPPSMSVLRKRLTERGTEASDVIEMRLSVAKDEISLSPKYDYILVNDELSVAIDELCSIITAERLKTKRNNNTINEVLEK